MGRSRIPLALSRAGRPVHRIAGGDKTAVDPQATATDPKPLDLEALTAEAIAAMDDAALADLDRQIREESAALRAETDDDATPLERLDGIATRLDGLVAVREGIDATRTARAEAAVAAEQARETARAKAAELADKAAPPETPAEGDGDTAPTDDGTAPPATAPTGDTPTPAPGEPATPSTPAGDAPATPIAAGLNTDEMRERLRRANAVTPASRRANARPNPDAGSAQHNRGGLFTAPAPGVAAALPLDTDAFLRLVHNAAWNTRNQTGTWPIATRNLGGPQTELEMLADPMTLMPGAPGSNESKIAAVRNQIQAGQPVAAALGDSGQCLFDIFRVPHSTAEPLSEGLATFNMPRVSASFRRRPTMGWAQAGIGVWTLADDQAVAAGDPFTPKTFVRAVPGTDVTFEISADVLQVRVQNMVAQFDPEWVAAALAVAEAEFAREMEQRKFAAWDALAMANTTPAETYGFGRAFHTRVAEEVARVRSIERLYGAQTVIDMVLPHWGLDRLLIDQVRQLATEPGMRFETREQVAAAIRSWGVNLILDYDSTVLATQGAGALAKLPADIVYRTNLAGATFVGRAPEINLSLQRDSATNAENSWYLLAEHFSVLFAWDVAHMRTITDSSDPTGASGGSVTPAY